MVLLVNKRVKMTKNEWLWRGRFTIWQRVMKWLSLWPNWTAGKQNMCFPGLTFLAMISAVILFMYSSKAPQIVLMMLLFLVYYSNYTIEDFQSINSNKLLCKQTKLVCWRPYWFDLVRICCLLFNYCTK